MLGVACTVAALDVLYAIFMYLKWDRAWANVCLVQTILQSAFNVLFTIFMAQAIFKKEAFSNEYQSWSLGQTLVYMNIPLLLTVDRYHHKTLLLASLQAHYLMKHVDVKAICYSLYALAVAVWTARIMQKEKKLFFYVRYVQQKTVQNYKKYFHNALSQSVVVVNLKGGEATVKRDPATTTTTTTA